VAQGEGQNSTALITPAAMPPRKYKVDHRRGGGSKHVSSFEDVKARNAGEESSFDRARRERQEQQRGGGKASKEEAESEEESSSEEEEQVKAPPKRSEASVPTSNPNAVKRDETKDGVELTRRQREELDKKAATRRYQELHKAGKTDEAQADLARLAEVKARREQQAAERSAREAAEREAAAAMEQGSGDAKIDALKTAMDEQTAKKDKSGDKAADKAKKEEVTWQSQIADAKDLGKPQNKVTDGTIEACRAQEEDFM